MHFLRRRTTANTNRVVFLRFMLGRHLRVRVRHDLVLRLRGRHLPVLDRSIELHQVLRGRGSSLDRPVELQRLCGGKVFGGGGHSMHRLRDCDVPGKLIKLQL